MYAIRGKDLREMLENGLHMGEKSPYRGLWIKASLWEKGERKGWKGHTIITLITVAGYCKYHRFFTQSTGANGGFAHGLSHVGHKFAYGEIEKMGFKFRYHVWLQTGTDAIRFDEPKEGIDY